MGTVQVKRIYEPADSKDGKRILVDRLWPRGLKKERAMIDEWMKAVAPSADLRKWFNHEPGKWDEFFAGYTLELQQNSAVAPLLEFVKTNKVITLLYAAHDQEHNHALVLQKFITEALKNK